MYAVPDRDGPDQRVMVMVSRPVAPSVVARDPDVPEYQRDRSVDLAPLCSDS